MYTRWLLIHLLVLLSVLQGDARAQWHTREVLVLDSADRLPVPDVAIHVNGRPQGTTDADGKALLRWEGGPALVRFAHVGYRPQELRPPSAVGEGPWTVLLATSDHLLGPVTVGRPAPVVVFQRPDLHAADLLVNDAGLWVLAYAHPRLLRAEGDAGKEILRDVRLVLLDTLFQEKASCPVPEDVFGLRQDLRNDVVVEGTRHAFGVGRRGQDIVLKPFGLEELRRAVLPWTDSIPGWVLGSTANASYPALDHMALDPLRDSTRVVCSVVDTFMMDLFRSEYKYMKGADKVQAMNLAAELGVDKEVVAGYMTGFSRNIWFRPLYAPLFVVHDTLLVFDHARGLLRKFTRTFQEAGTAPLAHLGKGEGRHWSGRLVQDRATRRIHAVFQRNGTTWLSPVDPVHGTLGTAFRLRNAYPERVQVHADEVYYIWRPHGSLQKRTLYREALHVE